MPKRRVTAKRAAQIRLWQLAGVRARSHSNPVPHGKAWPDPIKGSFGTVRRHKLGGKAYTTKSASTTSIASEAKNILAGKAAFRDQTMVELGHAGPAKVPVPKRSWYAAPEAKAVTPSKVHGSGTGLTSAYRYLKPLVKGKQVKGGQHGTF